MTEMKLLIVGVVAIVGLLSLQGVATSFSLKEEVKRTNDLTKTKEGPNCREQLDAMTYKERNAALQVEDLQRELLVLKRETAELRAEAAEGSRSCPWALEAREATCGPPANPVVCGWSVVHPAMALATARILKRLDVPRSKVFQDYWKEGGLYDKISDMYEAADSKLLALGIRRLDLPTEIHMIPIGGQRYFNRALRDADMIAEGMYRGGTAPRPGETWLDFGGSHGRVTQVMAAAYPDTKWYACDPLLGTIDWAKKHVPSVSFIQSPQLPPIEDFADSSFSGIYAISIWSHYNEFAALAWFKEMHRLLRGDGKLWISTHGYQAVNFGAFEAAVAHKHREVMVEQLYRKGHWYFPMFGEDGDWGNPDGRGGALWGYGAFTAEWMAKKVLNDVSTPWTLSHFGPGANGEHQDVYVLTKQAAGPALESLYDDGELDA